MGTYILDNIGSGDTVLDTEDLTREFGVPENLHLVIDAIFHQVSTANLIIIEWDLLPIHPDTARRNKRQRLILKAATANDTKQYTFKNGIHIRNDLQVTTTGSTHTLTFEYHFEGDGMDWGDENAAFIGDIAQVGGQMGDASAGSEYYQVGRPNQLGV